MSQTEFDQSINNTSREILSYMANTQWHQLSAIVPVVLILIARILSAMLDELRNIRVQGE